MDDKTLDKFPFETGLTVRAVRPLDRASDRDIDRTSDRDSAIYGHRQRDVDRGDVTETEVETDAEAGRE